MFYIGLIVGFFIVANVGIIFFLIIGYIETRKKTLFSNRIALKTDRQCEG